MKKAFALLLTLALVLGLMAGCNSTPAGPDSTTNNNTASVITKVALVTDVGTIDDESFNQACWQGVEAYCSANNIEYKYYQPTENTTDARVVSITQAIKEGANTIVMPGYLFGEALLDTMDQYPETYFIAVDVAGGDLTRDYETYYQPSANAVCITFSEEQAGYLAGYAAVKDGYTKLGFLGGTAVPAVIRYGYGFVQGADAAASELKTNIEINYTYGGQFYGDANITAKMEGWYGAGTEIVFACGGGIYTSAVEAAVQHNGMVIGVDVDQHYIGEDEKYSYNPFLTSAMKGLQNVTETVLGELKNGNWANYGGKIINYSLTEGDYVGLPTAETSWAFKTFTVDEYNTLVEGIRSGSIKVSNDSNADVQPTVSEYTTLNMVA